MRPSLALLLCCAALAACENGPLTPDDPCKSWEGDSQWGTAGDDAALALATLPLGVAVGGYTNGTLGVQNDGPVGNGSGFVQRRAPSGVLSWTAPLDSPDMDTVEALLWDDNAGTLWAAGRTRGSFAGYTNAGKWDGFLADVSVNDGKVRAVRGFGDARPQHPRALSSALGRVFVAGFDDAFVEGSAVTDWENPFLAVFGDDAAPLVYVKDRTPMTDVAQGVLASRDGGAFLAGATSSGSGRGAWVRRVAADGTTVWQAQLTSVGVDGAAGVVLGTDGLLRVGGTRVGSSGESQPFLAAVNPETGAVAWVKDYLPARAGASWVIALAPGPGGTVVLAGETQGAFVPGRAARASDDYDAFAVRFGPQGEPLAAWQDGTDAEDNAQAVVVDACGRTLVAGTTRGALRGPNAGGQDAFLVRATF